jgi:hypothetical protein
MRVTCLVARLRLSLAVDGCTTHPAASARLTLGRSGEEALQLSGQPPKPGVIRLVGHDALVHHDSSSLPNVPVDLAGCRSSVTAHLVGNCGTLRAAGYATRARDCGP